MTFLDRGDRQGVSSTSNHELKKPKHKKIDGQLTNGDETILKSSGTGRGPTPSGGVNAAIGNERGARGDGDEAAPTELQPGTAGNNLQISNLN